MEKKQLDFMVMALLILMIGVFIISYYVNDLALKQTQQEVNLLGKLDQQKNLAIRKLLKKVDITRRDLYDTRKDLELAKKDLTGVTNELKGLKGKLGEMSK